MKKVLFVAVAALGVLIAGCNRDSNHKGGQEGATASLKVTLKSETSGAKKVSRVPEPDQITENTVNNFAVLVFHNNSGALEKMEIFDNGAIEGEVTNLSTASAKKVVVLVNFDFTTLNPEYYSDLEETLIYINSQVPGDNFEYGLFMSGETTTPVNLTPNTTTDVSITVRRVVAKIRLESLTILPDPGHSLANFTLTSVSAQKVPYDAYILGEDPAADGTSDYWGGLPGDPANGGISIEWAYLRTDLTLPPGYVEGEPITPDDVYFYVFPNNGSNGNDIMHATLMSLNGTYNGAPIHYTFVINGANNQGDTTDGNRIERNKVYTLNVTLKRLGLGADDPDTVDGLGVMDIEVVVVNWEGELIQNVEW